MKKLLVTLLVLALFLPALSLAEPVTIVVSTYNADEVSSMNMLYEWFEVFEAQNPDVKLEYVAVPNSDYMTTYKTRFLAGDAADILFGKPRSFKDFIDAGFILDLTDYDFVQNLDPAVQQETTVKGRDYGVGLVARPKGVIYNVDMFEKYGIEIPKTYTEFLAVCEKFAAEGIIPLMHAYSYIYAPFTEHDSFFPSLALYYGEGDALSGVQAGEKKLADSKAFKRSMEIYNDLLKYQDPGDFGIDQARSYELFAAGERPMFVYGGWIIGEVARNNPDGRYGIFAFPWSETPEENTLVVGLDYGYMVNANSQHLDEALRFVEFCTSQQAGEILIKHTGLMSSVKGVSFPTDASAYISSFSAYLEAGKTAAKYLVPEMTGEYSSVYRGMLQEYAAMSAADRADVDGFIARMDAELAKID